MQKIPAYLVVLTLALSSPASAAGLPEVALPPLSGWSGASEALVADPDDPWVVPAERSGLTDSPDYDETVAWLRRLADASPQVSMTSIGKSPEGRDLWIVIASLEGRFTPTTLRANGRPTLLAQAGIHSGEIDGKDAGMMLLRDLTVRGRLPELLRRTNLIFLPIFNVDGHERASAFGRINQRGPTRQGWRTTARNLNLNRDYAKADTPEMQALLGLLDRWPVDLYVDLHVTDGADYQYDITYGWNGRHAYSPSIAGWLDERLAPALDRDLRQNGHVPGPLIFQVDNADPARGIYGWTAGPRFSNGYSDARHLPGVLLENHSLKPFRRRVLGTYVFLQTCLETLAEHGSELRQAVATDRARRRDPLPLSWKVPDGERPKMEYLAIAAVRELSEISGGLYPRFTGEPYTLEIPVLATTEAQQPIERPVAYWIPPAWSDAIERLRLHGIEFERMADEREIEVETYRVTAHELARTVYEGRVRVESPEFSVNRGVRRFPTGSIRVPVDQPLGDLAMLLLEPASADSLFQWGFFHEIFSRTEYAESYVMEPLARSMLDADPGLRAEFEKRLAGDAEFRGDSRARLLWFYERTPYHDASYRIYPVARER